MIYTTDEAKLNTIKVSQYNCIIRPRVHVIDLLAVYETTINEVRDEKNNSNSQSLLSLC